MNYCFLLRNWTVLVEIRTCKSPNTELVSSGRVGFVNYLKPTNIKHGIAMSFPFTDPRVLCKMKKEKKNYIRQLNQPNSKSTGLIRGKKDQNLNFPDEMKTTKICCEYWTGLQSHPHPKVQICENFSTSTKPHVHNILHSFSDPNSEKEANTKQQQ